MKFSVVLTGLLSLGIMALAASGAAAKDKKASDTASAWNAAVNIKNKPAGAEHGSVYDEKQIALITRVDEYFKVFDNVKGKFIQYSADNKKMSGKYYIKRPGRFRFDYNRPSRMVVVSDGRRLVIQDHDLNTEDEIALKKTPFRVLLRKNVNLLRDAKITYLQETDDQLVIELIDKNPNVAGGIRLFFGTKDEFELKEWITTDVQGLKTRIELVSMERVEKLSAKLFKFRSVLLPDFSSGGN